MGLFRNSVLALRVLQWVLLASFAVFALATTFGYVRERDNALRDAHAKAEATARQSLSAVANALWQYDIASLNALVTGMVASNVVVRAEVSNLDTVVADLRQPGFDAPVDRVWSLPVLGPDQKTVIGTLRISESYGQIHAQIAATLKTLIVTDLIKIVGLGLVLFAIVYRMVARHLRQLALEVTGLGHSEDSAGLVVARKTASSYRDEIDVLVDAINRFIAERNDEMRRRAAAEAQRRAAEIALVQSEENLAITLHSIGDAVIATDAQGRITRMNPTAERLTGWRFAQASGQALADVFRIVDSATRKAASDPVQRVMASGQVVGLANHTALLAREGHEYQISDSAAPIRNAAGAIVGVVLVFSDVTARYAAQEALAESRERYRALSEAAFEAIFISEDGVCLEQNTKAEEMFGYTLGEAKGQLNTVWIAQADRALVMEHVRSGYEQPYEVTCVRKDASTFPAIIHARKMNYRTRDVRVTSIRDISERKQAEEAVRIAATAFESYQGMFITNAERVILRTNKAFTTITEFSAEEAVGKSPGILSSGRHAEAFYSAMTRCLEIEGAWQGEIWNRRKGGEVFPAWLSISAVRDSAGRTSHYVAIFSDISERLRARAQIDTLAFYDPLTQLPNRRLLMDRLEQASHVSTRHRRNNALLFIDLDNFKMLNDTLGHRQGDLLLVQVARRLKTCIREGDTVAHLGSDEFVVMLEDLSEDAVEAATQAETVGAKILSAFTAAFELEGTAHHCTPSIGVALFGADDPETSDHPLQRAELAMFQSKAAGRNTLRFFDSRMQAEVSARAEMEADLRAAISGGQFVLHFQPQVVGQGRVAGVEALVRWQHPQRGMVSPAEFISLAEECGLILPLGQWVLEAACIQLANWAVEPELADLTMAVNVSARQFRQIDFVDSVLATLERTQACPKRLKLELTESMLVDDVEAVIAKMGMLKSKGVSFSLDDFGTGYSSLAYLKRLPLDQLKIDQGFIRNIVSDPNDAAIAKMVVALAESMGLAVIAEGVELQAQADFLAHLGCHAYQGYLFSRPLPTDALASYVRAGRSQSG
jgi:diguanylate cyclase (GGDEF)-like protein/PAS domain S-box-containing protein